MRPASLLCVLLLARVCSLVGRDVPVSAWSPVAYLWQDLLLVVLFAGIDLSARKRPWVGWTLYAVIVLYTVINVPVIRVLGTPLTRPMLRAAGAPLADSVAHYATFTNLALPVLVVAAAAALPRLFRRARPRHVLIGVIASVPVIAVGPLATARVETQGGHRNAVFALVSGLVPRVEATGDGDPVPDPITPSLTADDLARFRGAAANRNVVVVLLESAAAQYLRPYGAAEDPMPNLTALAGEGMLFEHAYAVYPESIKGMFAVLCSRYPAVDTRPEQYEPITTPSLAAVLRGRGYRTALFHSGRFRYLGMESIIRNRGFDVLEDAGDIGGDHESSFGIDEPPTVRRLLGWVDGLPRGTRFFATYIPIAGHHPYETPGPGPFPDRDDIDRYRNAQHYSDAALGELLLGLRARGLDRETLLIVIGDHGQAFGQHPGNFGHTLFLYEENVRIPFVIAAPGAIAGPVRVGGLTSQLDMAPTVLDLLGVPAPTDYQGLSRLGGRRPAAFFFTDSSLALAGLREENWKYIYEIETGRHKLFDLTSDPGETANLAGGHPDRVGRYKNQLLDWCSTQRGLVVRRR
jgi:arylsulfatase A-like enzyme